MSKKFQRRFEPKHLAKHLERRTRERSLIAALLERWALPAQESVRAGQLPLRLAIRDGYLNLYVNGQSVANISAPGGEPRISVHWKYVQGVKKGEKAIAPSREYVTIKEGALLRDDAGEVVDGWLKTADTYAGDEKRFVEHLVATNSNVIDLEMGLPGDEEFRSSKPELQDRYASPQPPKVAPRMDLVVAVPDDGGATIAFWEAKLATNGELRAQLPDVSKSGHHPHVWYQLEDYVLWLGLKEREQQVRQAYRATANILLELAAMAGKQGEALNVWHELAAADPQVLRRPGIVIANYEPKSREGGIQASRAESFLKYGKWLNELGCTVRQVTGIGCEQGRLSSLPEIAA